MHFQLQLWSTFFGDKATYAQAVKVGPKAAKDATVWVKYAEALGMTQGGTLTGHPLALLERALALNPTHPQALDLAGSAAWGAADFKIAIHCRQRLRRQMPSDDPRPKRTASSGGERAAAGQVRPAIANRRAAAIGRGPSELPARGFQARLRGLDQEGRDEAPES